MLPLEGEYCKLFRHSKAAKVLMENRAFLWWLVPYWGAVPAYGRQDGRNNPGNWPDRRETPPEGWQGDGETKNYPGRSGLTGKELPQELS